VIEIHQEIQVGVIFIMCKVPVVVIEERKHTYTRKEIGHAQIQNVEIKTSRGGQNVIFAGQRSQKTPKKVRT
jgi:hypothetical protein